MVPMTAAEATFANRPLPIPSNPLIGFKSNEQIDYEKRAAEAADAPPETLKTRLCQHIETFFQGAEAARTTVETRMLASLRQRKGVYDNDTKKKIEESGQPMIYDNVTELKAHAAESWFKNILQFQKGEKPWGFDPTVLPDLPPEDQQRIVDAVMLKGARVLEATDRMPEPSEFFALAAKMRTEQEKQTREIAKSKAERMEKTVEDQLDEGGFDTAIADFLYDFTTFPCAFIKGPVVRMKRLPKWVNGQITVEDRLVKVVETISPFDAYPDPLAVEVDDGGFVERKRLTPAALRDMRDLPGYIKSEVEAAIAESESGGLAKQAAIDAERDDLEDKGDKDAGAKQGWITSLEYWDRLDGTLLAEFYEGLPQPEYVEFERGKNYDVCIEKIGDHVIKIQINTDPAGGKPYYKASMRPVAGSFWGKSLPELAENKQRAINSTLRSMIRNIGMAGLPIGEVDNTRLMPGETIGTITPGQMIQTENKGVPYSRPAITYTHTPCIAAILLQVREKFARELDDDTGIPPYTYGNSRVGGAGDTLGGLEMLWNAASMGIKNAICQIDTHVIRPLIWRYWLHNMQYNPDESIKGDMIVIARGALALVVKEEMAKKQKELLTASANPVDLQIFGIGGRAEMWRRVLKSAELDPDGLLPDAEEFRRRAQAAAQQQMAQEQQQIPAEAGERKVA